MNNNTEPTEVEQATKQDSPQRDEKGRLLPGQTANPDGKGGFQDNPELRSDGRWSKDTSITYWYNHLGRMTDEEREEFKPTTDFQRIALKRIAAALGTDELALKTTKEITDRVEGRPKQDIDMNLTGDDAIPIIKGFVIPTLPEHFIDKDIEAQIGKEFIK